VTPNIENTDIKLQTVLSLLWQRKLTILSCALVFLFFGGFYSWWKTPVHTVTALLHVEQSAQSIPGMRDLLSGSALESTTEIQLIKSREVLDAAVLKLRMNEIVKPVRLPLIGKVASKYNYLSNGGNEGVAEPPLGILGQYAWGGEKLVIERFDVPQKWVGQEFRLIVGGNGEYELQHNDRVIGTSSIGTPLEVSADDLDVDERMLLIVSDIQARAGTSFELAKLPPSVISQFIQKQLLIYENGRNSGILTIYMETTEPERDQKLVNTILEIYVRQNLELRSLQASKSLEFIESQLPLVKHSTEAAEERLNDYKNKHLAVNLDLETRGILERLVDIDKTLAQFDVQRAELREIYTQSHPSIQSLAAKADEVSQKRVEIENELSLLPATQQDMARLQRDTGVNDGLYTFLLNKAQTLRLVEAGTVGSARIVDSALISFKPIAPQISTILILSILIGLIVGVGWVLAAFLFRTTLDSPEDIERSFGLPVFAVVPYSRYQQRQASESPLGNAKRRSKESILASTDKDSNVVEALRSLRVSMHFAMSEEKNNVILITGPSQGVGKSFIVANLGFLAGSSGRKTLVVDADIRRGSLHRYFNVPREGGLSDYLAGDLELDDLAIETQFDNVHLVTSGRLPANPAELLLSKRFGSLIDTLTERYDQILIDSPPILPVSDTLSLVSHTDRQFLVVRAGVSNHAELQETLKRLQGVDCKVAGVVINGMRKKASGYKYYYDYEYS